LTDCKCRVYRNDERRVKMKLNELVERLKEMGLGVGHVQIQAQLGKELELASTQAVMVFSSDREEREKNEEKD